MGIINKNGALYMSTGIDNSGLYSGLNQAEGRIDQFGAHISSVGDKIAKLTGIGFGVAGLKAFGDQVISVRGEMQLLETSFGVLLGNEEKSNAIISEIKQYAIQSPLSLSGVSKAAQLLLGFNVEAKNVMPTIKQLGDISMGSSERFQSLALAFAQMSAAGKLMGQDLLQMINAGFNPLQEISKQTGRTLIQLRKDMENGAISSEMVAKAFEAVTAEGGKFYGMTQKQSEGIKGLQAQLEGGLIDAYNNIGKSQNDIIAGGYKLAISLVNNYETIGETLGVLVASYGVYRAALVLNAIAESGWTISQMANYKTLLLVEKAQKMLNASMLTNPYVLAGAAVVALGYGVYKLATANTAAEIAQNALNKAMEDATKFKQELEGKTNSLISIINSDTRSLRDQIESYRQLTEQFPDVLKNIDLYTFKTMSATEQQLLLNNAISAQSKQKEETSLQDQKDLLNELISLQEKYRSVATEGESGNIEKVNREYSKLQNKIADILGMDFWEKLGASNDKYINGLRGSIQLLEDRAKKQEEDRKQAELMALPESERKEILTKQLNELEKQKGLVESQISSVGGLNSAWDKLNPTTLALNSTLNDILSKIDRTKGLLEGTKGFGTLKEQIQDTRDNIKKLQGDLTSLRKGEKVGVDIADEIEKTNKKLKDEENKLSLLLTGKSSTGADRYENAAERARREGQKRLDAQVKLSQKEIEIQEATNTYLLDILQSRIDLMDDSFSKQFAQTELNYDKELLAIEKHALDMLKAQQEAERLKWEASGKKGEFVPTIIGVEGLSPELQKQIADQRELAFNAWQKTRNDIIREESELIREEELRFASSLDQRLSDIDTYYLNAIKAAKGSEALIAQLRKNQEVDTNKAIIESRLSMIDFDAEIATRRMDISGKLYLFEADRERDLLNIQKEAAEERLKILQAQYKVTPTDELANAITETALAVEVLNFKIKQTPTKQFQKILELSQGIANVLGQISGMEGLGEQFNILGQLGSGLLSLSAGDLFGAGMSGLSAVSSVIGMITSQSERRAAIQRELNKLQQEYNISLRQQNYDLISSVDYARAFRENLEALQWLVEKGFISDVDYSAWEALRAQQEKAIENTKIAIQQEKDLLRASEGGLESLYKDFVKGTAGANSMGKTVIPILKDWKNGVIDTEEAYKRLGATGWKGMNDIADRINAASDETNKWTEELAEVQRQMDEFATGTSFDGFLGDAMSAIDDMRKGVSDLGDFTEKTLTNAILSSFKYKVLSNALEPLYNELADLFLADQMDVGAIQNWGKDFESLLGEYADKLGTVFDSLGIEPTTDTRSATAKGFTAESQDSANERNGTLTVIQSHTFNINENVSGIYELAKGVSAALSILNSNVGTVMGSLKNIDKNTQELYVIREDMSAMRDDINQLVVHGIVLRK